MFFDLRIVCRSCSVCPPQMPTGSHFRLYARHSERIRQSRQIAIASRTLMRCSRVVFSDGCHHSTGLPRQFALEKSGSSSRFGAVSTHAPSLCCAEGQSVSVATEGLSIDEYYFFVERLRLRVNERNASLTSRTNARSSSGGMVALRRLYKESTTTNSAMVSPNESPNMKFTKSIICLLLCLLWGHALRTFHG